LTSDRNALRAVLRKNFPRDHGQLLPALHFVQHEFGHLPDWALEVVGWHLGIPASEVYGAATSYPELRIEKPGQKILRVCTGLSCWMNGAKDLLDGAGKELPARPGETAPNGLVTIEETACGFLCAMAPVVEWDGAWIGRVSVERVSELVRGASVP
jgi:NADH:ubiquinone oxidoreductase subunit E